jgi:hypothetical protein
MAEDLGLGLGRAAEELFRLDIYGPKKEHIVSFRLDQNRPELAGATSGDMMQIQNLFWVQLGRVALKNKEFCHQLELAGIEVLTEDPNPPQAAPEPA